MEIFVALVTLTSFVGMCVIFIAENNIRNAQRGARIQALRYEFMVNINIINKDMVHFLLESSVSPSSRLKNVILKEMLISGDFIEENELETLWALFHEIESINYVLDKTANLYYQVKDFPVNDEAEASEKYNLEHVKKVKMAMQVFLGVIDLKINNILFN